MIEMTVEAVETSSPPTVTPDAPVTEVASHLRCTGTEVVPVLDDGTVVGVVTESDLVAMVAETEERPAVRAVMSSPVTTVPSGTTLSAAAEVMRTSGVKHLPVVDDGAYHGVLSASTLGPYLSRHNLAVEWRDDPLRLGSTENREAAASD